MEALDKFQRLVSDAAYAVAILGNGAGFELRDLDAAHLPELSRCANFTGVIGIVDGRPKTALAVPLDSVSVAALSAAFCRRMEDGFELLAQICNLPDNRTEVN